MIIPPYLNPGDKISIVSPAKIIQEKEIAYAIQEFEKRGLIVELGKHVFSQWNRFAGTDQQRLEDVQQVLDNPDIKAIFFSRGGYGSVRIIDKLDFTTFVRRPKWLVGYSDITIFHQHVSSNYNIVSCHGSMPLNMIDSKLNRQSTSRLLDTLFGKDKTIKLKAHKLNRQGIARGKLIGGNFSVLCSLIGTNSFTNLDHKILFIEDLFEEMYYLDRLFYQLKKSGSLDRLAGLIVGGFTDITDVSAWFGVDINELINEHFKGYNFPMAFDFPIGHVALNLPLLNGMEYELIVSNNETILK
ncbi:MAG: LD-carboxypeptidase [Crocinitomicaceae bacterium]|nr:LD-carboxypeptidase [Crocinitomicaceae bacterium]|tara:strand:+ start:7591 stop:8490 length:900 start_codon:yes stop_codon:yes gene_type:complete